jgi:hypothetical protein
MKASLLSFSIALSTIGLAANMSAEPQQQGAQIYTKQSFGYGKLVVKFKTLSTEPGIINGFFMLKYQTQWPNGWSEIDYEYVPGSNYTGSNGYRRTAEGNCGPGGDNCVQAKLGNQSAAPFISVNIIGGPLNSGAKPDSQVFFKLGEDYFTTPNTYTFEFTPDQVLWTASGVNNDKPFMYQKSGTNNDDIHQSLGMQYLVGREMYIWLNIYSSLGKDFGGNVIPKKDTEMVVEKVSFYPLVSGKISTEPSMSSDFVDGTYSLNGGGSTFDSIWKNEDFQFNPIYTKASHSKVVPGKGLVMTYTYTP